MLSKHSVSRREFLGLAGGASVLAVLGLAGCGSTSESEPAETTEAATTEAAAFTGTIRVGSLKGPTSIGLAALMDDVDNGDCPTDYQFTIAAQADEITGSLISGDIDIALVPANVGAVLYNKTEGKVSVVDINTKGVLYGVSGDSSVTSLADVAGKTVYTTGKGATPEYTLNYLLDKLGIADQVTVEFKDEATEVVSAISGDTSAVGILPEPFVTASLVKNDALARVFSMDDEWQAACNQSLVTGITVVRNEFLEQTPEAVAQFVGDQAASVAAVTDDPETYGEVVADKGILDSAAVASKAIPNCNLACITGTEMQNILSAYYEILKGADPSSIGGSLPKDNYYWLG